MVIRVVVDLLKTRKVVDIKKSRESGLAYDLMCEIMPCAGCHRFLANSALITEDRLSIYLCSKCLSDKRIIKLIGFDLL